MKNIPERIYLQVGDIFDNDHKFSDFDVVTWCSDRVNETDITYVLEKESQWISVKDRLPENMMNVLCGDLESDIVTIGHYSPSLKEWFTIHPVDVTHWDNLPEPPQTKEDEE